MHAGDEKGHLFVFDPSDGQATAPLNKDGTRAPSASLAAFHKDTVHSICFAPGPDPSNPNPRLITASACNRIGVWDVNADKHSWGHAQLLHKVKTKDITITGACALLSGVYMAGMTGALLSTNTAEVRFYYCCVCFLNTFWCNFEPFTSSRSVTLCFECMVSFRRVLVNVRNSSSFGCHSDLRCGAGHEHDAPSDRHGEQLAGA